MMKKTSFLVLVLEGIVDLYRTIQLSFISVTGWGTDLDCCGIDWFAFEMNRDHSVILRLHPRTVAFYFFVDYDVNSILLRYSYPQ